jgi:hypothetical protein
LSKILSSAPSSISTKSFHRPPPLRGDPWQDPAPPSASLTGHGLWPYWSRSVSQAHRSHSVMLLLDASLWFGLIQLVVSCLISAISTVLLSLSVNFSDRDVILNLALL